MNLRAFDWNCQNGARQTWQARLALGFNLTVLTGFVVFFFLICSGTFKPAPTPAEIARDAKIAELDDTYQKALDKYDDANNTPAEVREPTEEQDGQTMEGN